MTRVKYLLAFLLVFFLADRLLKNLAIILSPISVGDFFYFSPQVNSAGPFSFTIPQFLIMSVAIVALFWLIHLALVSYNQQDRKSLMAFGLMIVGGISNIWDRFIFGGVIDYWQISWPVIFSFNFADLYLLIGLIIIIGYQNKRLAVKSLG